MAALVADDADDPLANLARERLHLRHRQLPQLGR